MINNFDDWTEEAAEEMAVKMGLELTLGHFKVIGVMRKYYAKNGKSPTVQTFLKNLRESLGGLYGYSYFLKGFFPGYVEQIKLLSGVPE